VKQHTIGNLFSEPTVDMTQPPTLAPRRHTPAPTIAPNRSVPEAAKPRITRQAREVLRLLESHERVSVQELAALAKQYNARIKELRDAGYVITNIHQNKATGESWYELRSRPV